MKGSKTGKFVIIGVAIVLVVAVAFGATAIAYGGVGNLFHSVFDNPKDYYSYAERKGLEEELVRSGEQYDKNLAKIDFTNKRVNNKIDVTVGSRGKNFLDLAKGAGVDISWISSAGLESTVDLDEGKYATSLKAMLNGQQLISTDIIMDFDDSHLFLRLPDLSDKFLGADIKKANEQYADQMPGGLDAKAFQNPFMLINGMVKALPSSDKIKEIVLRYFDVVMANIEEMTKSDATVDVAGVTVECNEYSFELDNAQVKTVARALLKELRNDKEIEKIVNDMSATLGEAGNGTYDKMIASLEEAESNIDQITVERVNYSVYMNRKGEIIGRSFAVKNQGKIVSVECSKYEENGEKNLSVKAEAENKKMLFSGKGKEVSGKLSGEYTLTVDSKEYVKLSVDDYDQAAIKEGKCRGHFVIKPGKDADLSELAGKILPSDVDPSVAVLFSSLDPELDITVDSDMDHQSIKATLLESGGEVLVIKIEGESSDAEKITIPSDAVSLEDKDAFGQYLSELSFDKLLESLKKVGLPEDIMNQIETYAAFLPFLLQSGQGLAFGN